MPRPPILPVLDWRAIFESGVAYDAWLQQGENPENRKKMEEDRQTLLIEPHLKAALAGLARKVRVVAIAEDWCGDVVRHVPVLQKMAEASSNVEVRYVTRQQHPEVFVRFLTCGGEAIPKFVFVNDNFVECGNWGAMPEDCRQLIARGKALGDGKLARERVSARYAADPQRLEVARELMAIFDIAGTMVL